MGSLLVGKLELYWTGENGTVKRLVFLVSAGNRRNCDSTKRFDKNMSEFGWINNTANDGTPADRRSNTVAETGTREKLDSTQMDVYGRHKRIFHIKQKRQRVHGFIAEYTLNARKSPKINFLEIRAVTTPQTIGRISAFRIVREQIRNRCRYLNRLLRNRANANKEKFRTNPTCACGRCIVGHMPTRNLKDVRDPRILEYWVLQHQAWRH